jgi:hypothetical protein
MRIGNGARRNLEERRRAAAWRTPVTLHLACDRDRSALTRLAQLDSRRLPPGPHLVAIRAGRIDAAISLTTGEIVADPFRHTAELCELLRLHAGPKPVAPDERALRGGQPRPALAPT